MQEASLGGNKYLATFLDDFTKLFTVIPVPSKAEVIPAVKKTVILLENQSRQRLQAVRTERAKMGQNPTSSKPQFQYPISMCNIKEVS